MDNKSNDEYSFIGYVKTIGISNSQNEISFTAKYPYKIIDETEKKQEIIIACNNKKNCINVPSKYVGIKKSFFDFLNSNKNCELEITIKDSTPELDGEKKKWIITGIIYVN